MNNLQKAPSSMRPKQYPLLMQALLHSMGVAMDAKTKHLIGHFSTIWYLPFYDTDYNETDWSASWCAYRSTHLPAIRPLAIRRVTPFKVPKPTILLTEFDHPPSVLEGYCYVDATTLNTQVKDALRLWRMLLCMLTGNILIAREHLNSVPMQYMDKLYRNLRGAHRHLGSNRLTFNWCTGRKDVTPLVHVDQVGGMVAALASVWPGMTVSRMTTPVFMGHTEAINTSLNPMHAVRKVIDVARGMYGTTTLSKQINTGELQLVVCFLLLTNMIESIYCAHTLPSASVNDNTASTSYAVQRTINQIQDFVRVVVNDFQAEAGKLVSHSPKTFKLE